MEEIEVSKLKNLIIHPTQNIPDVECVHCVTGADATVSDLLLSVTEFNILMFYNRVVDGFFCGGREV